CPYTTLFRSTWQGEAAEAADAKVEGFTEAGTTVCAETEDFAGAISPAMDGIQQVVREYASFVLELGKEMKCAGKTPQETQDEIRKARGDLEFSDLADVGIDDLFSGAWAAFKEHGISLILGMTFKVPSWLEPGVKEACDTIRNRLIEEAKAWLDTSFKPEFDAKFSQFQQQSQSTQQQVQEIYDKLLGTQISESPFDPPAEKPPAEKPPAETTPSSTNQPSANDRGGGDIGGDGNDTGGGGISPRTAVACRKGASNLLRRPRSRRTCRRTVSPKRTPKSSPSPSARARKPSPSTSRSRTARWRSSSSARTASPRSTCWTSATGPERAPRRRSASPLPVKLDSRCPANPDSRFRASPPIPVLSEVCPAPTRTSSRCKPVRTARSSSRRATGLSSSSAPPRATS